MPRGRSRERGKATSRSTEIATATFHLSTAAGFERVVGQALLEDVRGSRVMRLESGLISLQSSPRRSTELALLPYLSVALIEFARARARSLDASVEALAERLQTVPPPPTLREGDGFRVRVTEEGHLVKISARARSSLERAIGRWAGLRLDPRGGGRELWVVRRRGSPDAMLSLRLDRPSRQKPARGELKRDVAAALVRVVPVRPTDVFLDPFAGSGALPRARARYPARRIVASDLDPARADGLGKAAKRGELGARSRTGRADARDPASLARLLDDHPVDVVVTDPPWGQFEGPTTDVRELYRSSFGAVATVAGDSARLVVLTAAGDEATSALSSAAFDVDECFPVLVNGRKATVLAARRAR